jgi:hypothetical protein
MMVEWLHQLVLDYFLASELIQALIHPRTDAAEATLRCLHAQTSLWAQPCVIALGLLDRDSGAKLLRQLIWISPDLAASAFDAQDDTFGASIADALVGRLTSQHMWDPGPLRTVTLALPFASVVDALFSAFKQGHTYSKELLAKAICEFAIEHSGQDASSRAQKTLEALIGNVNETVRFYAAKGLWSRDRGRASAALRDLHGSTSEKVRMLVRDLAEEWGIE